MSHIRTIRLKRALPLLVIGSFAMLLFFSVFYQHQQMLMSIENQALDRSQRLLANTQLQVETLLRHEQHDLIEEEIAGYGVDADVNNLALVDDTGRVMQATRLEWIGQSYQQVLPQFVAEKFHATQSLHRTFIEFSADRQSLFGYQPVVLAAQPGQIRSNKIGVLILDFDLSRAKAASWDVLIRSMYPIFAVGLLLMLVMGYIISHWVDRPLRHLTEAVSRLATGDYAAVAKLTGTSELATFAEAWNRMLKQLTETISLLEESKERLSVTLFSIGDAVIATDTDSRVTFMNEIAQKLTGWRQVDAVGEPLERVFNIINAHTRQVADNPVKRVLSTGQIIGLANHTVLINRNGNEYQIADSAAPIRTQDGSIFGVVLVFRDVTEEYDLRESLLHERALLRCIIDAVPDLIFIKDLNSVYLGCNKAFEKYTGHLEAEQIGKTDFDFLPQQIAEDFRRRDLEVLAARQSQSNEEWVVYPDGNSVLLDTIKTPFYTPDGELLGLVGISRDVTERQRYMERLAESEERIRSLGNNLPHGYIYQYTLDSDGNSKFLFISAGVEKVHGISVDAVLNNAFTLLDQIDPAQLAVYREAEKKSAHELSDFSMELCLQQPNSSRIWIQVRSRPKRVDDITLWDGIAIDITDKKLSEEQIWRQANFDPLTGLPNRHMFHNRLEQEIKKAHRNSSSFALLFIDLDRFKEVNDTLGHMLGDRLLEIAAQRLLTCIRDTDTVARLGGDEFTIILTDLDNPEAVQRVAQTILDKMMEPFPLNGEQSYVSASIGVTIFPDDGKDIAQLLQNADQAMYAAKDRGRNGFSYFTAAMQDASHHRLNMANDLRIALAKQQFQVYYQPIIELDTGFIHKAEALIRWHHPSKGLISPALFIPVAEENGLIHDIGDWVFKEAAQYVKNLRETINPCFQISINRSPVQFRRLAGFHFNWLNHLQMLGLAGDSVVIEITEGLLLDASVSTSEKLLAYRDAGIQVSLDDFGTGYSSLSYIQKFDIDYLKIDRSFVNNLAKNSTNMALCEAIILMAHKLGIKVIAEGIETEEQCALLTAAGCDYGQGYLFSRPVPPVEFEQLFQTYKSCD
ncbi:EAL domain-containing protein [Methylomonas sp. AM2-LC]|uniref:bifunctional diguanylate cyclase/phosphodiesterase n=1 Tax=Methylomonas sp. AM2-LC TaxID=3153301 RepID=UPI003263D1C0